MGEHYDATYATGSPVAGKHAGINVGTCVIVSGATFEASDAIQTIGGGFWLEGMQAWIFPESKRAAVIAALPGCKIQRLRKRDFFKRLYAQHRHSVIEWIEPVSFLAAWSVSTVGLVYFQAYTSVFGWFVAIAVCLVVSEVIMTLVSVSMAMGWIRFKGGGQQSDWLKMEMVGAHKAKTLLAKEKETERIQEDLRRRRPATKGPGLDGADHRRPHLPRGAARRLAARARSMMMGWRPPQVVRWDIAAHLGSRTFGRLASLPLPRVLRTPVFRLYGSLTGVNFSEVAEPLTCYGSLNKFFTRSLKPGLRRIASTDLVSPVDAKIVVLGEVTGDQIEQVKGASYSMSQFLGEHSPSTLGPNNLPRRSLEVSLEAVHARSDGKNTLFYVVQYLNPGDYHRIHSAVDMHVERLRHFPGTVFPISPVVTRLIPNLFAMNERVVLCGEWKHGAFSQTAVGAYNVGSIHINFDSSIRTNKNMRCPNIELLSYGGVGSFAYVKRYADGTEHPRVPLKKGMELGRFNMGSTVVLIFEAPKEFEFTVRAGEHVRLGQALGSC